MSSSAPRPRTRWWLRALAVPITYAPRALAICTARWPTPPAAAWISTRCPADSRAVSASACHAVSAASGSAAACTWSTLPGFGANARAGAVTYSACEPTPCGYGSMPKTSSPGLTSVTPYPTASTTPDTSQPSTNGGGPRKILRARCFQSVGFSPAACTRTRTWLRPASGRSSSTCFSTSGPPKTSWLIARIAVVMPPGCPTRHNQWLDCQCLPTPAQALCRPGDRQPFDTALEVRAQERRLARVAERGRAGQHLIEQRAHLGAGEMGSQAEVRAVTEHQVGIRVAADVKTVRASEDGLVAVGRGERDDYLVSFADALPAEFAVSGCRPAEDHDRRPPAQHLLGRDGHQRRIGAQFIGCVRGLKQRDARAREAVTQRLIPSHREQPEHVLELGHR